MPAQSSEFVGDIPSHYDAELGPNIFIDYAADIAARAAALGAKQTLELAALCAAFRSALPASVCTE
jgi:hypothetical protein